MKSAEIENNGVIKLDGEHTFGSEHSVWLDRLKKIVTKFPNAFGKFWQKMNFRCAERDSVVMRAMGIPMMPMLILRDTDVAVNGTREKAAYVLRQPLYEKSHAMSFGELLHNDQYSRDYLELMRAGSEIRTRYDLGLDLIGGEVVKLLPGALDPRVKALPASVANLLVAEEDIIAVRDWPEEGITQGSCIARKGEFKQCDTRMYDFNRSGIKDMAVKQVLLRMQDAQDTVNWKLLDSFGHGAEFDFEATATRRMVANLMDVALPKMQAYAEGVV